MGEDSGQPLGTGRVDQVGRQVSLLRQDGAVEEENRAECLVLGGGGNFAVGGEVGDKCADFLDAKVFWVLLFMKDDVAFDPVDIGLFGAVGVVFGAQGFLDLLKQFFGLRI